MADVFISYKAEDRRRIQPLVGALQADGYSVWWDQHIAAGEEWRQTIERELDAARCVVVVWSKRSVGPEGRFVRDEAARAQQRGAYVPVTIDPVRIPLGFGESQASSLRGWRGDAADPRYQAVLSVVERVVGGSSSGTGPRRPVRVTRRAAIAGGALATLAAVGAGGWALWKRTGEDAGDSIAVLPFASFSGDPAQTFFAAGIAGEIRNTLTRVAGLKVAGSTSSEAVREDDAQTAARKLGVANILTGNVRQTPTTIRVTAELIDGETGLSKWSQNYDRAPGDVIKVQTDIAKNVAEALAVALNAGVRQALAVGETSNIAAQTLVFQARNLSYQLTIPALQQCIRLLDRAIALDPDYARAYAMKAFVANNLVTQTARTSVELMQGREQARGYAEKALALAPDLSIGHSALAFSYSLVLQVPQSVREHRKAVSLAAGDPDVIRNYGFVLTSLGDQREALRLVDEALALDPLNWASHYAHALVLYNGRRYTDAVNYSLKLKRQSPELFRFSSLLGRALLMLGRTKEAIAALDQSEEDLALLAAHTGDRKRALEHLGKLQNSRSFTGFFSSPTAANSYLVARVHAQLGDPDTAFGQLERAWEQRDSNLIDLKVDPFMAPLHGDARYAAMLRRIGLPT